MVTQTAVINCCLTATHTQVAEHFNPLNFFFLTSFRSTLALSSS